MRPHSPFVRILTARAASAFAACAGQPLIVVLCIGFAHSSVAAQSAESASPIVEAQPLDDPEESTRPVDPPPNRESGGAGVGRGRRTAWVPIGVTSGWLGNREGHAFVIGGELSVIWVDLDQSGGMIRTPRDGSLGFGVVLDAVWVSNPSHFRGMLGAELVGYFGELLSAGIEVGATFHSRGEIVGFRARGFFTIIWPMIYAGIDYHGRMAGEVGLLLKFPIPL